ncbi:MAG: AMP-binding protein [Sphingomonadaceae bacterium]|nr:AMP-binding protein [Sphingomonadaceae bacterium]
MTVPPVDARNLADAYVRGALAHPAAPFILHSAARPARGTLAEIHRRGLVAGENMRQLGVAAGEVVAVQLPSSIEWLVACVGIAHIGAVMLPIVSIYGAKELSFILPRSRARLLITPDVWRNVDSRSTLAESGPLPDLLGHLVVGEARGDAIPWSRLEQPAEPAAATPRDADDVAVLIYTSGTTAEPKGVQHSARSILAEFEQLTRSRRGLDEINLNPWPPGHVAGAWQMFRYLASGNPLIAMEAWEPGAAAALVERHRVSVCSFTPYTLMGLIDAAERDGRDLSSIKSCMVGAAPVPPTLIERCAAHGLQTFRCYGSSEHPTVTVGYPDDPLEKRLKTEGRPMLGIEMRFVDEDGHEMRDGEAGEIALRGPDRFIGYTDPALNARAFLPDGWFLTGDVGRLDEDGFLIISDRKKDIIIRGGENISSREVEDLLFSHPDIAEAAVVAAPDPRMSEIVCAFVIARPCATVTLESIAAHFAAAGVARQKTPERLMVVADLPRNATGKVLKQELRAIARERALERAI